MVPEKRLNLLMASPSITRRRTSLMPSSSNSWNWQNNIQLPTTDADKSNETSDNDDEEELPLLAIPKLLLRRASTQLGFKGLGGLKIDQEDNADADNDLEKIAPNNEVSCEDAIKEETEEEVEEEDERITIEIVSEVPKLELSCTNGQQEQSKKENAEDALSQAPVDPELDTTVPLIPTSSEDINHNNKETEESGIIETVENVEKTPSIVDEQLIEEGKSKSQESVLYIEAESIRVPSYPRANEPPLEFYPYALTKSNNNILYVIAESLAIPKLFLNQGSKASPPVHSHDNPAFSEEATAEPKDNSVEIPVSTFSSSNNVIASSVCDASSNHVVTASSANLSDFDENKTNIIPEAEVSTSNTPVKVGTLFCPWSSEIADSSRSMPNIKSNSCNNSPILPHNQVKMPEASNKLGNPKSIDEENDKTSVDGESFDPFEKDNVNKEKETDNQILDANELLDENRKLQENVSKSRSSYFLPRSPTIETQDTFIEDESDDEKHSKSLGMRKIK